MDKNLLRQKLKAELALMPLQERVRLSQNVAQNLEHFLIQSSKSLESMVIGAFAPLPDEPDWTLSPKLRSLALAFVRQSSEVNMTFYACRYEELETRREFGVSMLVPPKTATPVMPDIVLVPGLGFSLKGERLGRGRGFYDRWLAEFKGKKIGLCFEAQLLQELPTDPHDVLMDVVVTQKQVLSLP